MKESGEPEMLHSYGAELFKLRKRPAVWVIAAVWLGLLLMFTELLPYVSYRSATDARRAQRLLTELLPANLPGHAIGGYPMWGGALIVVLGALCLGSEYGWGTLKTMLANRPGRLTVYLAQLGALATALVVLVVVGFALCGLCSIVIANSAAASVDLPAAVDVARAMGAGWLVLWMWCLFGVALAVALRGTALSIGLGLVWVMAIENLIRATAPLIDVISKIEKALPGVNAGSLVAALGGVRGLLRRRRRAGAAAQGRPVARRKRVGFRIMIRTAGPDDVPAILELIRGLAEYERAAHEVKATEEQLREVLFGPTPRVFAHVAEHPGADGPIIAGFALWFMNFSTWTGRHGIYLEDLYVRPELRGHGYGKALLIELARICVERGYGRFEWSVLDWNEPSIGFYRALGAIPLDEWTVQRLTGEALHRLASTS
jgi:GNAT superfamily N-acetyltransferase/ABC-type transport system involved in multi-copper enzyme maturation permease subunit